MYTGQLIDELIETVERAENSVQQQARLEEEKLAYFYALAQGEMNQYESALAGVA